ncbi:Flp pilus assembly protein CpaB, partial [Hyphomonas sp.]|uniref:Flp pilus assembly protein CpaB n=1 Tax=Hyphomonas sp. TaxID=87 RepID=UPI00391957D6
MKALPLISLGLSLILGAGAVFFGREFMSERAPEANAAPAAPVIQMSQVIVAAARIEAGQAIEPGMVRSVEWPEKALPPGALTSGLPAGQRALARGTIFPGEPILEEKVSLDGAMLILAANITPGMRAVSIVVQNDTGVAGFILPGDRVDVNEFDDQRAQSGYLEGDSRTSGKLVARAVLKSVKVLAVDQTFAPDLEGARLSSTVTLEVTPEDALLLGAANRRGALALALISRNEDVPDVMVRTEAAAPPPPPPTPGAGG